MKKCPRCQKQYDDTWDVCLSCGNKLETDVSDETEKSIKGARQEIDDIRQQIGRLCARIDYIEETLSEKKLTGLMKKQQMKAIQNIAEEKERRDITGIFKEPEKEEPREKGEVRGKMYSLFKEDVPKQKKQSWTENFEQILGGKWFNKLGILAVVVGVALLIGYSFKYLGPVAKLSIGYFFGIGLLCFGSFIEKKENFSVYGKTLIAGGWAINYFTTFAMHHISAVQLVKNPFLGLVLLLGISIANIVHIYKYRSQVATGFSYLLMFITLMITPISLYSVVASLLVAVSLLFFMYKMQWNAFALYGMVMSYLCYMAFLARTPGIITDLHFFMVFGFLALYWIIFVIAGLFMKENIKKVNNEVGVKQITFIANSMLSTLAGWMLVVNGFDKYLFLSIGAGIFLHLLLTAGTFLYKKRDAYIISSTFGILFLAIYISLKFSGYSLTVAYVILAQVVLLAGILLKERYWRQLSSIFFVVVFTKLFFIDSLILNYFQMHSVSAPPAVLLNLNIRSLLFMLAFLFFLVNHSLYSRICRKGLIPEDEGKWSNVLSYAYPAIFALGTWLDLPKVLTAPSWMLFGVILLQIGISKQDYHRRMQGYVLTIGAFSRLFMSNMMVPGGITILSYRVLTVVPVISLLYYCQMLYQDKKTRNVLKENELKMEIVYPYLVFTALMFLLRYEMPKNLVAPAWSGIALLYAVRSTFLKKKYYLPICSFAALSAGVRIIFINIIQTQYLVGFNSSIICPMITIVAIYFGNILFQKDTKLLADIKHLEGGRIKRFLRSTQFVYALVASVALTTLIITKTQGAVMTVILAIEGLILFLAGFLLKEKNWRMFGLIVLLITLCKTFLVDLRQLETLYYILSVISLGVVLLFVSYVYTKHKDKIKKFV